MPPHPRRVGTKNAAAKEKALAAQAAVKDGHKAQLDGSAITQKKRGRQPDAFDEDEQRVAKKARGEQPASSVLSKTAREPPATRSSTAKPSFKVSTGTKTAIMGKHNKRDTSELTEESEDDDESEQEQEEADSDKTAAGRAADGAEMDSLYAQQAWTDDEAEGDETAGDVVLEDVGQDELPEDLDFAELPQDDDDEPSQAHSPPPLPSSLPRNPNLVLRTPPQPLDARRRTLPLEASDPFSTPDQFIPDDPEAHAFDGTPDLADDSRALDPMPIPSPHHHLAEEPPRRDILIQGRRFAEPPLMNGTDFLFVDPQETGGRKWRPKDFAASGYDPPFPEMFGIQAAQLFSSNIIWQALQTISHHLGEAIEHGQNLRRDVEQQNEVINQLNTKNEDLERRYQELEERIDDMTGEGRKRTSGGGLKQSGFRNRASPSTAVKEIQLICKSLLHGSKDVAKEDALPEPGDDVYENQRKYWRPNWKDKKQKQKKTRQFLGIIKARIIDVHRDEGGKPRPKSSITEEDIGDLALQQAIDTAWKGWCDTYRRLQAEDAEDKRRRHKMLQQISSRIGQRYERRLKGYDSPNMLRSLPQYKHLAAVNHRAIISPEHSEDEADEDCPVGAEDFKRLYRVAKATGEVRPLEIRTAAWKTRQLLYAQHIFDLASQGKRGPPLNKPRFRITPRRATEIPMDTPRWMVDPAYLEKHPEEASSVVDNPKGWVDLVVPEDFNPDFAR